MSPQQQRPVTLLGEPFLAAGTRAAGLLYAPAAEGPGLPLAGVQEPPGGEARGQSGLRVPVFQWPLGRAGAGSGCAACWAVAVVRDF